MRTYVEKLAKASIAEGKEEEKDGCFDFFEETTKMFVLRNSF